MGLLLFIYLRKMRTLYCWLILIGIKSTGLAQAPTFLTDVQPIIMRNCATPCHHTGGVGPFRLLTYDDVAKRGKFIAKVTQSRYMPPFPADRQFQHYTNERGLSEAEIETIQAWVRGGMKKGETAPAASHPKETAAVSVTARQPDLVFRMKPYLVRGDGQEDFRYFHVPMNLTRDIWVEAIEFVPGNRKLVHHSRLMVDSTGTMSAINGIAEADPKLREFQRTPLADEFLYGWVPGNDRVTFPAGAAKRIRAGSDLILNIHYAPSAKEETDQSEVRLYLARQPVDRVVRTLSLTENDVTNQPFRLAANTKPVFYMKFGPLPDSIRLLSVMPHMHRLGQSVKAFAITPDGDAINLIQIPAWDYNWQLTYFFRQALTLPKGTVILAEAQYDNTDQNPFNPHRPARTVGYGWNSTDEMMNLVFYYIR